MQIDKDSQLSTFSLIRTALLENDVISAKFKTQDIYEFDPKEKGSQFKGFPYIWVNLPFTSNEQVTLEGGLKTFTANLYLRVEFMARDKFTGYANAVLVSIKDYEKYFQREGYMNTNIELLDIDPNTVIHQKELVEGTFEITWHGQVR